MFVPSSVLLFTVVLATGAHLTIISPFVTDTLLKEHQDGQLLHVEASTNATFDEVLHQPRQHLIYRLGVRVAGDDVLSVDSGFHRWASPQSIRLIHSYPPSGAAAGAVVSCVEIRVNQSNTLGRALLLRGGVGQRFVTVVVEAINTYWFGYSVLVYGHD